MQRQPNGAEKKPADLSPTRDQAVTPAPPAETPAQDEWGLFDPEQCGFKALDTRLEELSTRVKRWPNTKVRLIRY